MQVFYSRMTVGLGNSAEVTLYKANTETNTLNIVELVKSNSLMP